MKRSTFLMLSVSLCFLMVGAVQAEMTDAELIANAESAAPASVTANATIKAGDGRVLREGSSSWTCYPGSSAIGPMCVTPPSVLYDHSLSSREATRSK